MPTETVAVNHQRIDERSQAFGGLVADPDRWIAHARANLARWLTTCSGGVRGTLLEWDAALQEGPAVAIGLLTGTDERSTRLRQSSTFAGVLSNAEHTAVLLAFADQDPSAT